MAVKLGIITPVLSRFPGVHAAWEVEGTIDQVARVAGRAEELGYEFMTCSEHVAIPAEAVVRSGGTYWDPLATFGYVAARTSRIRLATAVLVLPYHHPLEVAKRYGTLDRISGGRLVLGVGVGYLQGEFEALGIPYEGRNERGDDAIGAIRAAFGRSEPLYEGSHYRFEGLVIDPCGVQDHVPIWVGGRTRRSLRRAAELADGWYPFDVSSQEVSSWLRDEPALRDRTAFEVVLAVRLDPLGDAGHAEATVKELAGAGVTALAMRFVHDSIDHYLEQLQAMKELADRL